ncbi:MAG TPA: integration host factor subunit alpha [Deltaproteobacteria bacterium]|nr:integration host factor subunit alpha [Deltaproteobacteria bacterium]
MALTKAHIIESIHNQLGLPKKNCAEIFESLLDIMKNSLADGDDVLISGFGKFCIKDKKERRGRNPATGSDMMLDQRRVVTFRCSSVLRSRINGD